MDTRNEKWKTNIDRLASDYLLRAGQKTFWEEVREALIDMKPTICFSRKIGVGSRDLAFKIAQKIGYRVVDKEIVEFIAKKAEIHPETVEAFDESYPGHLKNFFSKFFNEKSFQLSNYSENLFAAFFFLATSEPTIFVGRGAHLVLPREKVFAVRCISSKPYRVKRVSHTLSVDEKEAERILEQADSEQRGFYNSIYQKSDAHAGEFDVVVNFDYLQNPDQIANALIRLFASKFRGDTDGLDPAYTERIS